MIFDDQIAQIILITSVGALCISTLLLLLIMRPAARMKDALKQKAARDYNSCRGTVHRNIINKALDIKVKELAEQNAILKSMQYKYRSLRQQQQNRLSEILAWYLVENRLTDIPGIGEGLKQRIMLHVFRGDIGDLKRVHQVPGIGDARYQQILNWVRAYESRFAQLLERNFPGKNAIITEFATPLAKAEKDIESRQGLIRLLDSQITKLRHELTALTFISEKDFVTAALKPKQASSGLEAYAQGVFAPWDPMPEWFRDVLQMENR